MDDELARFGAIATHSTPISEKDHWDGPAAEKNARSPAPLSYYSKIYAWYDEGKLKDGELSKSDCKFPHHEVAADGTPGSANLSGCRAIIANLHGARGGTTIPKADYRGVYNHAARHLRDAGEKVPPYPG